MLIYVKKLEWQTIRQQDLLLVSNVTTGTGNYVEFNMLYAGQNLRTGGPLRQKQMWLP